MSDIINGLSRFFTSLFEWLTSAIKWVVDLVVQLFEDVWNMITDGFCWAFEKVLDLVISILQSLTVPSFPDFWGLIPAPVANVMGLIGLGQCLALIGSSILIRITLQLIPFTRLGS